jgi:hypothetical protein
MNHFGPGTAAILAAIVVALAPSRAHLPRPCSSVAACTFADSAQTADRAGVFFAGPIAGGTRTGRATSGIPVLAYASAAVRSVTRAGDAAMIAGLSVIPLARSFANTDADASRPFSERRFAISRSADLPSF